MSSTIANVSSSTLTEPGTRLAEQGDDAEGEGDVGRHRDAPSVDARRRRR